MTQDSADGCKAVYVGNLDSRVNTAKLTDLFPASDRIRRIKILPDRHVSLEREKKIWALKIISLRLYLFVFGFYCTSLTLVLPIWDVFDLNCGYTQHSFFLWFLFLTQSARAENTLFGNSRVVSITKRTFFAWHVYTCSFTFTHISYCRLSNLCHYFILRSTLFTHFHIKSWMTNTQYSSCSTAMNSRVMPL